ncbi:MAG: bifunctional aldolase/short-chain dehydrogenase [Chloroflexota bacterium]
MESAVELDKYDGRVMESRWVEQEASKQPELEGLLYASRLTGADQRLVLWGGGNTSAKVEETDFRGRRVRVLRVKGSGSDLRTIQLKDFPGVRLDDVLPLQERDAMSDEEMVAYLAHTLMEPSSPRPSIETLLHAFLPARFVIHTHADAILALTNTPNGRRWVAEALGPGAIWIKYRRPGFALSKQVAEAFAATPDATAIVLEKHGLITWGETAHEAYEATIQAVTQAERFIAARRPRSEEAARRDTHHSSLITHHSVGGGSGGLDEAARRRVYVAIAPLIRGLAGRTTPEGDVLPPSQTLEVPPAGRVILRFDDAPDVLVFASDRAAGSLSQIGPATPDHLINTKRTALYVETPHPSPLPGGEGTGLPRPLGEGRSEGDEAATIAAIEGALEPAWRAWVQNYARYVRACDGKGNAKAPDRLDPRPRVVLLPGVGMVTLGRDAKAARVAADIYHHAVATIRDAEAVEAYASLDEQDCFDVEYWPLEVYKLTLAPPEAELSRKIVLVTGAASGIGRAIVSRLCQEGAQVAVSDLNGEGAQQVAAELNDAYGSGRAIAVQTNVVDEADVQATCAAVVEAFGGLDILVSNAGIAPFSPIDATSLADWQRSLDVNATGHFLATREAIRIMKRQGIGGNVIFVATKNTMAPGKEFGAYSAAKSAQAQLARVAAMEVGEHGIRVNMINPDAVFRGSTLWSPELRRARASAHGVSEEALGDFYRQRCLLGVPIYPEDVAEAAWWLASERSRKTTGGVITVDGGVPAAFPR